ncbi:MULTISPECIES: hypothetical protein [unclassified Pseudomonas]|uniref:hypothetical protein n=1 Tax=Pseudomonas TaxID=286 RepID=UPI0013157329|nr:MULTISPECIES: hypothetical protein [unclassified Pseudomonas]UQS16355.1 hypothetical protein JJN09_05690 [Pseudomonas sp. HS6]WPN95239.1 hypothetical protein SC319_12985 [Pseudomonas sp. MUP56]WPO00767.1 hypothetical protein SC318_12985 [Pseudomonas sp. MUP55]
MITRIHIRGYRIYKDFNLLPNVMAAHNQAVASIEARINGLKTARAMAESDY